MPTNIQIGTEMRIPSAKSKLKNLAKIREDQKYNTGTYTAQRKKSQNSQNEKAIFQDLSSKRSFEQNQGDMYFDE